MEVVTPQDRDALGNLMSGDGRLVFVRYRDAPTEPYYLEDGSASDPGMREFVRDELECLLPGCADRRLHLVNRHGGRRQQRDGFRHSSGTGGHSAESLFHEQAKLRIQRWLRDTRPELQVQLEGATADRSRRADVLITWPNGRSVAVEIQYSPLPVNDWIERHRSYQAQGITDLWLFGNDTTYLRRRSLWGRVHIDLPPPTRNLCR